MYLSVSEMLDKQIKSQIEKDFGMFYNPMMWLGNRLIKVKWLHWALPRLYPVKSREFLKDEKIQSDFGFVWLGRVWKYYHSEIKVVGM